MFRLSGCGKLLCLAPATVRDTYFSSDGTSTDGNCGERDIKETAENCSSEKPEKQAQGKTLERREGKKVLKTDEKEEERLTD